MAETLLTFGVEKLWDLLVRESDRFKGVDEKFTELKSDLNLLRSFLKDADAKKHARETVRNCVEEIKEIVLDAEDVIETFLLKEELRKESGFKKRMRILSCVVADRMGVASEMEGISKRISKVIRDMQSFGVQQMVVDDGSRYSHPVQERQREMRHTFPSNNESNFVGLEKNVKKLVGYLVEEESVQVVSVCGMGGIGKTTLARQVFNHDMVKKSFDGVVWVCVSQQFTRKYVWGTILQKLSSEYDEDEVSKMTEDKLQEKLFGLLEATKSLIVLDDMWKEEDWDIIKTVFPPTRGWKLLLTSRNEAVALRADPTCIILKPEFLTTEESWTLFQRIAFPLKDLTECKVDDEMEEMGKEMIKHCRGLPLAVKVLGGLLAVQYTLPEWKMINENIGSHIVGGTSFNHRNISSVYHVLSLSFEELPIYLKHCFLYLAHYPEDCAIDVGQLSYYWAAEGIKRTRYCDGASIRDVADGYIAELVKRNMVISERSVSSSRFETCQLHDMMREVCLLKAKEDNFLQIVHDSSTANSKSLSKARRLTIHRFDERYLMEGQLKNPKLRSLMFIVKSKMEVVLGVDLSYSWLQLTRLPLIRVLVLNNVRFKGNRLPSDIGKLIHLRYLNLFWAWVSYLPSSLQNLKLLLYLNLNVFGTSVYVPNVLKEMRELKYLQLPISMHGKTSLELGSLVNLEELGNFSTEHGSVTDLQGMTKLRSLSIDIIGEGCTVQTLSSSLSQLKHLENLTMHTPRNDEEGTILGCMNLRKPKSSFYMPRLFDVQHLPSHLTYISLWYCRFEEDPMPVLEKLLHLKDVILESQSFCGRRMVCSAGGFPQLHKLKVRELGCLEEWILEEGSMPFLHYLTIHRCQKLKELPDGLRFMTSLKVLGMGNEWKERSSEGGEDYYKVQHIPSLDYGDDYHRSKTSIKKDHERMLKHLRYGTWSYKFSMVT